MRAANLIRWISVALTLFAASSVRAHPARLASAVAKISRDGHVSVTLTIDLLAFALNDTPQRVSDSDMLALLNGPSDALATQLDDAKDRLLHGTQLQDGTFDSVTFPTASAVQQWKSFARPLPVMMDATLVGRVSLDASAFSLRFPEALGSIVLTVDRPGEEACAVALEGGEWSPAFPLALHSPTTASATSLISPVISDAPSGFTPSRLTGAFRYARLGFEHILPQGPDHILFILGLFLLSPKLSALLWQISAFTIAHSITLGLALYGVVRLPPAIVEPLIAASIAFVAIENLLTPRLHAWRPIVVFCFGLIHGMGFAGVLMDMGLPRRDFATALVSFNVGVELGQIAVVIIALLAVGWFRKRSWYRRAIVLPGSCAIAAVAVFWTIQRIV